MIGWRIPPSLHPVDLPEASVNWLVGFLEFVTVIYVAQQNGDRRIHGHAKRLWLALNEIGYPTTGGDVFDRLYHALGNLQQHRRAAIAARRPHPTVREQKLEAALAESIGTLRTLTMFMTDGPATDIIAAKVRAWEELLKPE